VFVVVVYAYCSTSRSKSLAILDLRMRVHYEVAKTDCEHKERHASRTIY